MGFGVWRFVDGSILKERVLHRLDFGSYRGYVGSGQRLAPSHRSLFRLRNPQEHTTLRHGLETTRRLCGLVAWSPSMTRVARNPRGTMGGHCCVCLCVDRSGSMPPRVWCCFRVCAGSGPHLPCLSWCVVPRWWCALAGRRTPPRYWPAFGVRLWKTGVLCFRVGSGYFVCVFGGFSPPIPRVST